MTPIRSRFLFVLALLVCGTGVRAQSLADQLAALPGVRVQTIDTPEGFVEAYELHIQQPLDHDHPELGQFEQRVYLSHRDVQQPMVMVTQGYSRARNGIGELTRLVAGNQLDIEHRYFGTSMPDSLDYAYLNLKQATADLHHINALFRSLYTGKWLSTGISKGGATTVFYRYFYPNDVDVSVPYVAPINRAFEEPRIYQFLDTVGTDACRAKLLDLQLRVLEQRTEALPLVRFYSKGAGLEYTYLTAEEAFEFAVLEFPFSFWQWGHHCEDIPGEEASLEDCVEYLLDVSDVGFFADGSMKRLASHYYQSAQEMGYYGYETEDFEGLLEALPLFPHPHAAFTPNKSKVPFDGVLLTEVNAWLDQGVDRCIYIYGAQDTWSASAVPAHPTADALWFVMAGKHHGNARIKHMSDAEFNQLVTVLERWLEMEIDREAFQQK